MSDAPPDVLKRAAVIQLVSGAVNLAIMPFVLTMAGGLCGAFTFGVGSVCSLGGCVLIPVGILEVVAGALGLAQPDRGAQIMRYATWAEYASILGGGVHSAVVGYLVSGLLEDAEVQMYLEGH